jgi:hypothetical protein
MPPECGALRAGVPARAAGSRGRPAGISINGWLRTGRRRVGAKRSAFRRSLPGGPQSHVPQAVRAVRQQRTAPAGQRGPPTILPARMAGGRLAPQGNLGARAKVRTFRPFSKNGSRHADESRSILKNHALASRLRGHSLTTRNRRSGCSQVFRVLRSRRETTWADARADRRVSIHGQRGWVPGSSVATLPPPGNDEFYCVLVGESAFSHTLGRTLPAGSLPKADAPGRQLSGAVLVAAHGARADIRTCAMHAARKRTPLPTGEGGYRTLAKRGQLNCDGGPSRSSKVVQDGALFRFRPSWHKTLQHSDQSWNGTRCLQGVLQHHIQRHSTAYIKS